MTTIELIKEIPDVEAHLTGDELVNLRSFIGKPLIVFFYPRANTPGCTQEGKDFRDAYPDFQALDTTILGASRDKIKAQSNFRDKYEFPFPLISDPEEKVCNAFNVIKEKMLYGKISMGIERSTFLFDSSGQLVRAWRKVKVKGHVEEVLTAVKNI